VKLPLQAGIFGLEALERGWTRFQLGEIGLQHMQTTSGEGDAVDWAADPIGSAAQSTDGFKV